MTIATALVQLLDPTECLLGTSSGFTATAENTMTFEEVAVASMPLLIWFTIFAAVAVADRVLIMSLVASNYLTDLVVASTEIVAEHHFAAFEKKMSKQARQIPKFFALGVVAPVIASVSSSILATMLEKEHIEGDERAFACVAGGPGIASDYYFMNAGCSSNAGVDPSVYLLTVAGTFPVVQLFTPVLAAVMLMLMVIEVHVLQLDGALKTLYESAETVWSTEPKWLHAGSSTEEVFVEQYAKPEIAHHDRTVKTSDRVTDALQPFVAFKASLRRTSKQWSFILATEVVVVSLLAVEPVLQSSSSGGGGKGAQCAHHTLSSVLNRHVLQTWQFNSSFAWHSVLSLPFFAQTNSSPT